MPRANTAEHLEIADMLPRWAIYGPSDNGDWKDFSLRLVEMLRRQREVLHNEQQTVAGIRNLLESGRYQTAFLVGVVELEGRLNRALGLDEFIGNPATGRQKISRDLPRSLRGLLTVALQLEMITITPDEITALVSGRNQIVHGGELPADHLRTLTELVLRLLEELSDDPEE
jgi:hypothetical protein